ncbi:MAG: hypothetical protein CM15mP122_3180 [Bacteroidota bacterium]|nr:MAG: hypothetical protein CM15mP122_3180 [Bacteroidota bacterium]
MYNSKEIKEEIFKKFGNSKTNTGSPEGQIALFTHRIHTFLITLNLTEKTSILKDH